MQHKNAYDLLSSYLKGEVTPEEKSFVENYYGRYSAEQPTLTDTQFKEILQCKVAAWENLQERITVAEPNNKTNLYPFRQMARIAAIFVGIGAAAALYYYTSSKAGMVDSKVVTAVMPNTKSIYHATLQLPSGEIITLDILNQEIVLQKDNSIRYADGTLLHSFGQASDKDSLVLTTQRGGQYHIRLADGSLVSLNSESKLTFPLAFTARDRGVKLAGEAFFSIEKSLTAQQQRRAFYVEAPHQTVKVLGTKFNVLAYPEEKKHVVTLVEGSVEVLSSVKGKTEKVLLIPNEEVVYANETSVKASVVVKNTVEWTSGNFVFADEPLADILEKIGRWYAVDIDYQREVSGIKLIGIIPRKNNLTSTLDYLTNASGINFKIMEGRVIVMK